MSPPSSIPRTDRRHVTAPAGDDVQADRLRLGAKVLVASEDGTLLVRERRSDGSTFWTLPGGGIRPTETLREGLRREVNEELRCGLTIDEPVATCAYQHVSSPDTVTVYTVYSGSIDGDARPNPAEGIVDSCFFGQSVPDGTLSPFRRVVESNLGADP